MKTCNKCKETKGFAEFNKSKASPDGHQYTCRICKKADYLEKREHYKQKMLVYNSNHKDRIDEYNAEYRKKNKEKRLNYSKQWRNRNPDYHSDYKSTHAERYNEHESTRRSRKKRANVVWANQQHVRKFYEFAKYLSNLHGSEFHVDHIEPLTPRMVNGEYVEGASCGLHNEFNLQVIPADMNHRKNNVPWETFNG